MIVKRSPVKQADQWEIREITFLKVTTNFNYLQTSP